MVLVCGTDGFVDTVAGPIQRVKLPDGQKRLVVWHSLCAQVRMDETQRLWQIQLPQLCRKVQGPVGGFLAQLKPQVEELLRSCGTAVCNSVSP